VVTATTMPKRWFLSSNERRSSLILETMPGPPPIPQRTLEVSIHDLEPDPIETGRPAPKASPVRAMLSKAIFAAVLATCLAIMALASKRLLRRHGENTDAPPQPVAAQTPAPLAQPAPAEPSAAPSPPGSPPAAAASPEATAAASAPAAQTAPLPKQQVYKPTSLPRKPSRTVRASH
jgi:hypothetical protein